MRIGGYKMDPYKRGNWEPAAPFPWREQLRGWPILVGLIALLVTIIVVFA